MQPNGRARLLLWAGRIYRLLPFFAFAGMSLAALLLRPLPFKVAFTVIDDAMYYLKLAQNFSELHKFTYDGVTLTNGFHPLWQIVLLPVYMLIHDPSFAVTAVFWLVFAICCLSLLILYDIGRRLEFTLAGLFTGTFILFTNLVSFTLMYSLLESAITLFAYLLCIRYSLEAGETKYSDFKPAFLMGLFMGFCCLARIDSFLLPVAFGITLTYRVLRRRISLPAFFKCCAGSLIGVSIVFLPYLLINYAVFGRLMTVSAWRKLQPLSAGELLKPLENCSINICLD